MSEERTVITPKALASYAYVHQPRRGLNADDDPQYSITLLFDKKDVDLTPLRKAARAAVKAKWGDTPPPNLRSPFRDGDVDKAGDPMYAGKVFITAKTYTKPGIVDQRAQPILDPMDFYSGCYCRASVYANAYDRNGNKGVNFLLNNLQKLGDGPRLAGRKPAEQEFEPVPGEPGGGQAGDFDDDIPF